ncbi:conserved Plasmodium protein, unknown function [Plasmodium sp. gorilla clade G2]|uniref:conserved Plasmodium protein, unknown function n=1 Tax=Plasmodium sp. gorilla clade G2 TaxID=880535 RepID=UPI000D200868|nr:conserved Plasmodium protein, unknown function [Plasmodium sp. gorilla clade G2]SOV18567.1 conserved Plasmodium protein, unknown function [Plasmodium sp. gorilla clade G2]
MENIKKNEENNNSYFYNNNIDYLSHNDILFFQEKNKNKIGLGRVVNFDIELDVNDIKFYNSSCKSSANYCLKILNNIDNKEYVKKIINKLNRRNKIFANTKNKEDNIKDDIKNNTIKEKKKEYSILHYFNKRIINNITKSSILLLKNKSNNNNKNFDVKSEDEDIKNEKNKTDHKKESNIKDCNYNNNNNNYSYHMYNITNTCETNQSSTLITQDERRNERRIFYFIQSLETYKYNIQYKRIFKHYKILYHKQWKDIKTTYCKNIQNKIVFVLAMKIFQIKKLYPNNIHFQNVMINNLMKIYKSEKDLHVNYLILNYIKKLDVRVILQNCVLISNDEFNEILSKHSKNNDPTDYNTTDEQDWDHLGSNRASDGIKMNTFLKHQREKQDVEDVEDVENEENEEGVKDEEDVEDEEGDDEDVDDENEDEMDQCKEYNNNIHNIHNIYNNHLNLLQKYKEEQLDDHLFKSTYEIENLKDIKNEEKKIFNTSQDQGGDLNNCKQINTSYLKTKEGNNLMHNDQKDIHKYNNNFLNNNEDIIESETKESNFFVSNNVVKKRKIIEGETYKYELKGNILAKFKSPYGIIYRGHIKNIFTNKNNILSYFLIVPSIFFINNSFYFSCLNIDIDILKIFEIIKILDKSKIKQIDSINFNKYKNLKQVHENNLKIDMVHANISHEKSSIQDRCIRKDHSKQNNFQGYNKKGAPSNEEKIKEETKKNNSFGRKKRKKDIRGDDINEKHMNKEDINEKHINKEDINEKHMNKELMNDVKNMNILNIDNTNSPSKNDNIKGDVNINDHHSNNNYEDIQEPNLKDKARNKIESHLFFLRRKLFDVNRNKIDNKKNKTKSIFSISNEKKNTYLSKITNFFKKIEPKKENLNCIFQKDNVNKENIKSVNNNYDHINATEHVVDKSEEKKNKKNINNNISGEISDKEHDQPLKDIKKYKNINDNMNNKNYKNYKHDKNNKTKYDKHESLVITEYNSSDYNDCVMSIESEWKRRETFNSVYGTPTPINININNINNININDINNINNNNINVDIKKEGDDNTYNLKNDDIKYNTINNNVNNEYNSYLKQIQNIIEEEKMNKVDMLYKYSKNNINILLYIYVMHIYINKLCKNIIVKILKPNIKYGNKTKYDHTDFILSPLIGYSYSKFYRLKFNYMNIQLRSDGNIDRRYKLAKEHLKNKQEQKKNKIKKIKNIKNIKKKYKKLKCNKKESDTELNLSSDTDIYDKRLKIKKDKIIKSKNHVIKKSKCHIIKKDNKLNYKKNEFFTQQDDKNDKNDKDDKDSSKEYFLSNNYNINDDTDSTKKSYNENINFYLWCMFNWDYRKTLRVSLNSISNKKINNFDIYNFFFYNYDTISNLNEINKDLGILIDIYKSIKNILYQNLSLYGDLLLLNAPYNMTRTHTDEELICFWLKTLNQLYLIRDGFSNYFKNF